MKIVLDSNIIIAGFSVRGLCHSVFELCIDRFTIVLSEFILSEVFRALTEKLKMPARNAEMIVDYLREFCTIEAYDKLSKKICRDENDDEILALAKASRVEFIITGDKDLLDIEEFDTIKIITPREFWSAAKTLIEP